VWRARIILATAEGCGTDEIMRRAGVSKPCVWRWQERFMSEGVAGLLRDKTRKPGSAMAEAVGADFAKCNAITRRKPHLDTLMPLTGPRLIEHGFPCHQVGAETQRERGASSAPTPKD
jgi:hypothetical protein